MYARTIVGLQIPLILHVHIPLIIYSQKSNFYSCFVFCKFEVCTLPVFPQQSHDTINLSCLFAWLS